MQLLLIHGIGGTPVSLFGLASALRRDGHRTRFFGYFPTLEPVLWILRRLTTTLRELARSGKPVGLVGHSFGGVLLRMALPGVPQLRVHHLVTLGTPHSPPRLARIAWRWLPLFRLISRDCGRLLTSPEAYAKLPPVAVPCTTMAGTKGPRGWPSPFGDEPNDGLIAVSEAGVSDAVPELFPVQHFFMMDAVAVRARISAIMSEGRPALVSPSDS